MLLAEVARLNTTVERASKGPYTLVTLPRNVHTMMNTFRLDF